MSSAEQRARHWHLNRRLSLALLLLWLAITLGVTLFAEELNRWRFIGPLGFYMAAQGALLIYLAIIAVYAQTMERIDQRCGLAEPHEESEQGR